MSLIIFFGMALFIFAVGSVVIGVTFYQWKKQKNLKLKTNTSAKNTGDV